MKKLAAVVIFVGVLLFNTVQVSASAHTNPNGGWCSIPTRRWYENGLVDQGVGTHTYGDGQLCTVTYYKIGHKKVCNFCGFEFASNVIWECTQYHGNCSYGMIKNCTNTFIE